MPEQKGWAATSSRPRLKSNPIAAADRLAKDLLAITRIEPLEDRLAAELTTGHAPQASAALCRAASAMAATRGTSSRSRAWNTIARSALLAPGSYSSSNGS